MPPDETGAVRAPFLNRLFDLPDVSGAEGVRWVRPANHMQRRVARSGALFMNEEKLGFAPRGIDKILGARAVTWNLASISDIELKPTLRKLRVTVTTAAGKQRFIVSDPAIVFNDLQAWCRSHESTSETAPPARSVPAEEGGASA
jgi:hypothetical protein